MPRPAPRVAPATRATLPSRDPAIASRLTGDLGCTLVKLVLASRSPRRREILRWLGVDFEVVESNVEELSEGLDPEGLVLENARRKAAAGLAALGEDNDEA